MIGRNAVLIIADEKQFPPAVFLASRLASLNPRRDTDIVLATDFERGLAEAKEFGGGFDLLDIRNLHRDLDLPIVGYFTRATYFSLFVPRLLEQRYDRLLYLDVDTYPQSAGAFALLDLEMESNAVAAVRDVHVPFLPNPQNGAELIGTLGISPADRLGAKYLNSGVLLIDLHAYGLGRIEKQALRLIRERKNLEFPYADQTVFNAILHMRWLELSPSFNMVTRAWSSFIRAFAPPAIVHFTGPVKPWHRGFVDDHPVRRELEAFLKGTPWANFIAAANPPPRLVGGPLPPAPRVQRPLWEGDSLAALVRYLRETPFADVEQGLTTLDWAALPAPVDG